MVVVPQSFTSESPTAAAYGTACNAVTACREEQRKRPLLGDREPLEVLKGEYQDPSTVFGPKINSLVRKYVHFRRTRQDGNCFYRSFLFGTLEELLSTRNSTGTTKLIETVKGWKDKLLATGYQELVFEDALDMFVEFLEQVKNVRTWGLCCGMAAIMWPTR